MRHAIIAVIALFAGSVLAFGVPGTPDVPDVEIPDIEIPGMDLLDEVQIKLDEVISSTDVLGELIPALTTLDNVSAKLEELRDTDPEIAALQAELDELRGELAFARDEIQAISDNLNAEIGTIRDTINSFIDGLPIP